MARAIFSGILIVLSVIFLISSVVGIGAIWFYNEPLTREVNGQLKQIDLELGQAQATLVSSEKELQRALRIVDGAQEALDKLNAQSDTAEGLLQSIQSTLDDRLLPELKTTRERIGSARTMLENLQSVLAGVSSFIPGLDLNAPDQIVTDLIASTVSLDTEIANVEGLAARASTFVSDSSYLLEGDLSETRDSLQSFLTSIQLYEQKVDRWREQENQVLENAPRWIDQASISLTIFLLWFGISQFGLLLHGLSIRRGDDPFDVLRRRPFIVVENVKDDVGTTRDIADEEGLTER